MENNLIAINTICTHYEIEFSFIDALRATGLIHIHIVDDNQFLHEDTISDLEKMIRLHQELHVNIEGIDVIFNLLEKENTLKEEIITLKNRLRLYEND